MGQALEYELGNPSPHSLGGITSARWGRGRAWCAQEWRQPPTQGCSHVCMCVCVCACVCVCTRPSDATAYGLCTSTHTRVQAPLLRWCMVRTCTRGPELHEGPADGCLRTSHAPPGQLRQRNLGVTLSCCTCPTWASNLGALWSACELLGQCNQDVLWFRHAYVRQHGRARSRSRTKNSGSTATGRACPISGLHLDS